MKKKLNLGCGNDIRSDYVNLDIAALDGVDVVHDLNQLPLPFEDGVFEEILCLDVFEHVDYPPLLRECHRILSPGGRITIEVPHFSSNNNFVDPTHRNRFSVKTLNFFVEDSWEQKHRPYYFDFTFSTLVVRRLLFIRSLPFFWNYLIEPVVNISPKLQQYYEATGLTYLFPAQNLRVVLQK
ncbi:MAG: methyltransferase domain-containing protein [Verrucomicrobiales bacterium]|nr:methyltransferase domain-containing protein [Verrucomicrobiales bacterium]